MATAIPAISPKHPVKDEEKIRHTIHWFSNKKQFRGMSGGCYTLQEENFHWNLNFAISLMANYLYFKFRLLLYFLESLNYSLYN